MRTSIALLLVLATPTGVMADQWMFPNTKTYESANGSYMFIVKPWDFQRRDSADNIPRGLLVRTGNSSRHDTVWSRELVNRVAPVSATVSDNGEFVVTFDDWGGYGFGDNVVVIYGQVGQLIDRLALSDFVDTPFEMWLPGSTGSMGWQARPPAIIDDTTLALFVHRYSGSERWQQPVFDTVVIDLESGRLLTDLSQRGRFVFRWHPNPDSMLVSDRHTGNTLLLGRDLTYQSIRAHPVGAERPALMQPQHLNVDLGDSVRRLGDFCVNVQQSAWIAASSIETRPKDYPHKYGGWTSHDMDLILWDERMDDWGIVASEPNCRPSIAEWSPDGEYFCATSRGEEVDRLWVFRLVAPEDGFVSSLLTWEAPTEWEIWGSGGSPILWYLDEGYVTVFITPRDYHDTASRHVRLEFE